jgi:L-lactate dehydrogenase (cytochrome)
MGEEGVSKSLEVIANELDLTMAFCGLRDIRKVTDSVIWKGV